MKKFLLPLLFLFLFLLESLFVQYAPHKIFGQSYILVPHFLFAGILFLTIYSGRKYGIIYGAIFGFYLILFGLKLSVYTFFYFRSLPTLFQKLCMFCRRI